MSVGLYDKAFIDKLESWTRDTKVTIVGPNDTERLFQVIADGQNDKPIQLPLISLKRAGGFTVLNTGKRPLSFDGALLDATDENSKNLNAIPISIPYQLDLYTRYRNEADEYIRNIVFNIINYPKMIIDIPYNNEHYKHAANIRMSGDVEDNSDIPERIITGQFYRMSINIVIDDAYLWDVRYRDVYSIEYSIDLKDNELR